MKKILTASAALLIAAGAFATAQAADEPGFKVTGNSRLRVVYRDDFDFGKSPNKAEKYMDSRVRLNLKGTAASGAFVSSRLRLMEGKVEYNGPDGTGSSFKAGNVWSDWAYFGIPFSDSFTMEAGKYRWNSWGHDFFIADQPGTGVRGIIKAGDWKITPFVEVISEGTARGSKTLDYIEDNDAIRYGVSVESKFSDNWKGGIMVAYQSDDRTMSIPGEDEDGGEIMEHFSKHDGWLGSLYFTGNMGAFGLKGEFSYHDGSLRRFNQRYDDNHYDGNCIGIGGSNGDEDDESFGGFIQPSYTIDALTLSLNLGFTTGNFGANKTYGFVMIGGDHSMSVLRLGDYGDWLWGGFIADYKISDSLKLTGNVIYVDVNGYSNKGDTSLERLIEVSGAITYTITKGAVFTLFAGALIPSFEDPTRDDDPAVGSYGRFVVSF